MARTVHRVCTLCEATCGLDVDVEGHQVVAIRGDAADPFSKGHRCAKAQALADLHHDPDRLRRPLVREGEGFREADWDEAFARAGQGLLAVREAGGPDAIALFRGNPSIHDLGHTLFYSVLQRAVGSRNMFSAGSVDTWPRYVQVGSMFGGQLTIPVPDIDRTDHWLVFGANPIVSNGSLMTVPDVRGRIHALRARGGKLVVVDPKRTETADVADEHHFVRPGSDAALALAMVQTLFAEDLVQPGRCAEFANGLEHVVRHVAPYTPEAVHAAVGIDPATIRRLAREFAAAPSAVAYGRMGTCCQRFGTLASWAIELLNFLTGNLDREGGAMFTRPAASLDFALRAGHPDGLTFGRHQSRVEGYDEILGELPVAALPAEIETPGDGRIRALLTQSGNPVISTPDSDRLDRALASLDFMVAIDFYVNETTRHADVILPPHGPLEADTYDLALNNLAVRNVAKWSPAAVAPDPSGRGIGEIVIELAKRLMGLGELDNAQVDGIVLRQLGGMALAASPHADALELDAMLAALGDTPGPARLLDGLLRLGPYGDGFGRDPEGLTLARLKEYAHGLDLGPLVPMLPGRLGTASGRIELAPPRILADLPRLDAWLAAAPERGFLMIGRRDARSMNSWLHNSAKLAKGKERCTLQIHPDDAARLHVETGDRVAVKTAAGALEVPVELSDRLMPGVVSLPHGWGHDAEGARLSVASQRPGVNTNRLLAAADVDAPSGASMLNGVPVELVPSA